jgi:hypothetical protein
MNGTLYITGDTTTPANCFINASLPFLFDAPGVFIVDGFKVASSVGAGIYCRSGSRAYLGKMEFSTCATEHMRVEDRGSLTHLNSYSITGGAATHHHVFSGGIVNCDGITVTLTGTPAFVNYFCGNGGGNNSYRGTTFSGSATGMKYIVHSCGTIYNNGAALPGSIAGNNIGGTYNNYIQSYGTPSGEVAAANVIGEYTEYSQAAGSVGLASGTSATTVNAFAIPPGNYDIWGCAAFNTAATTSVVLLEASISSTSGTLDTSLGNLATQVFGSAGLVPGATTVFVNILPRQITVAAGGQDYFLVTRGWFSASTLAAGGIIRWRRRL